MEIRSIILQLESDSKVFQDLLINSSAGEQTRKPAENKWCLLEIVCHLYDEEKEDFKPRLSKILNGDHNWEPIDPQGWVLSRNYMEKDFSGTLNKFLDERKKSVDWLNSLNINDWNVKAVHPKLGEFTAYQMLCNWLAHDFLHIRQILKLKYQLLESGPGKDMLRYAGDW
ncbi:MAG: DinB family protein [Bacteroidetes bacterium]|nr:DinB family protein [Bacteroidota bacterium]